MKRREFIMLLSGSVIAWPTIRHGSSTTKMTRSGHEWPLLRRCTVL